MGNPITVTSKDLSRTAYDHLWMHFTRMSSYENAPVPTIVRGEGTYIYDDKGKRYLDGLAGLFVVQAGHGRTELAETAFKLGAEQYFSDALPSPNGAVVLFWKETQASRKPQLAEVRDKVATDYAENEKRRQFVEAGKTVRSQLEARLKAGDTFEQAAAAASSTLKLQAKTLAPFTLRQPPQDADYSILGSLERLEKGQVSDLLVAQDKGSFVYVIDKKAPDLSESSPAYITAKAQLSGSISRYNADSYLQEVVAQELKKSEPASATP